MLCSLLVSVVLAAPLVGAGDDTSTSAAEVDRLVTARLAAEGRAPGPAADDATFLRRATLDVVGRIPTAAEAAAFLDDPRPDKRARLVDELLDAPGYDAHLFHWWADLLRARDDLPGPISGAPFVAWIKRSIADDLPYDEMVAAMLTASGPVHAPGNGATGYFMRDRGMPEDNMSNTARVFLGMRIECAQCHDDPYGERTQRQYYEFVAFTGGIDYRLRGDEHPEAARFAALRDRLVDEHGAVAKQAFRRAFRDVSAGIAGSGTGATRLPGDYAYDDAAPRDLVSARTLDGRVITDPPRLGRRRGKPVEQGSRAAFAEWLTSPDNDAFVRVIANRMWARVFGRGLVEPLDDLDDFDGGAAPALLGHLAELMVAVDFDLREFQRVLLHTDAYARRAALDDDPFPGAPVLRRLSAHQVWDSWMTLIVPDLDARLAPPEDAAAEVYADFDEILHGDDAALEERVARELLRRTDRDAYDDLVDAERAAKREVKRLTRKLERARIKGRDGKVRQFAEALAAIGVDLHADDAAGAPGDPWREEGFARAADLDAPAPPEHLLRTFGQSDRSTPSGGHLDPSVPQALALMNGVVDEWIAREDGAVLVALARTADPVETAFLAVLARRPTPAERALWAPDLAAEGVDAQVDLLWTLLNSHEFLFLR